MSRTRRFALIADSMRVDLKSMLDCDPCSSQNLLFGFEDKAHALRKILIGLEEPGAMRSQGTIDLPLDGSHCQEVVALCHHSVLRQPRRHFLIALVPHHGVETNGQCAAFVFEPLVEVDRCEGDTCIVEAGDALR